MILRAYVLGVISSLAQSVGIHIIFQMAHTTTRTCVKMPKYRGGFHCTIKDECQGLDRTIPTCPTNTQATGTNPEVLPESAERSLYQRSATTKPCFAICARPTESSKWPILLQLVQPHKLLVLESLKLDLSISCILVWNLVLRFLLICFATDSSALAVFLQIQLLCVVLGLFVSTLLHLLH
jgi:hypothetical protein